MEKDNRIIYNDRELKLNKDNISTFSKKVCGLIRHIREGYEALKVDECGYVTAEDLYERANIGYGSGDEKKSYKLSNYDDFLDVLEYIADEKEHSKIRLILLKENNKIIKIRTSEGYSRQDVKNDAGCVKIINKKTIIVHCSYKHFNASIMKEGLMLKETIGKKGETLKKRKHIYFYKVNSKSYNALKDLITTTGRDTFYYTTIEILEKNNHKVYETENGVILVELDDSINESITKFTVLNENPLKIIEKTKVSNLIKHLEDLHLK
jgi:RNA:NAD 2'-phosphotransferase (TPT1/KptA family)